MIIIRLITVPPNTTKDSSPGLHISMKGMRAIQKIIVDKTDTEAMKVNTPTKMPDVIKDLKIENKSF